MNGYQNKRALVVDNSPVMGKLIKNHLTRIGFEDDNVWLAQNGNQAFMMLDLEPFDLLTTGLHMNMMGGLELVRKIRNHQDEKIKSMPCLVITAERGDSLPGELQQAGADELLNKPFTLDKIRESVTRAFGQNDMPPVKPEFTHIKVAEESTAAEDPLSIPPEIIKVFVDSTLESISQYMVTATPGKAELQFETTGNINCLIDLSNSEHCVRLVLSLSFPEKLACSIYEGLFGEIDKDQVIDVFKELVNIIGGMVKPELNKYSKEIHELIHPGVEVNVSEDHPLTFDLGLPSSHIGEFSSIINLDLQTPMFIVPFAVDNGKFALIVAFQKE